MTLMPTVLLRRWKISSKIFYSSQFRKVGPSAIASKRLSFPNPMGMGAVETRITPNVISSQCGWVQVMMATLVFILPNKKEVGKRLMNWGDCKKLPWDIVLVLGGGMCSRSLSLSNQIR